MNELEIHGRAGGDMAVQRSADEIKTRITDLNTCIEGNDVWIYRGLDRIPEPRAERLQDMYRAKLNELKWLLGEDLDVTHGVQGAG